MSDFTPLIRPLQSQVTIDSVAKDCPSEGFNYPVFRQLNKQARVSLSQPFNPNPSTSYRAFAVANAKGWFAAIQSTSSGSAIIFSTLEGLRSAFSEAKEDDESLFSAKRTLPLHSGRANIVTFACNDTRLVLGLESGSVAIYDTAALLSSGTDEIQPLTTRQIQSSPLRQIISNPGSEPELVAVVGDGNVVLLNMQLEPQGGWAASDLMTQPISVAWSPKGKHIAIGLQTGDILTYSLTSKSSPHKHIPPTADAILVSLNWPGPGHTFRTSYAAQGEEPAKQHIIVLDSKSSTATYFAPDHPFPCYDRTAQNAYVLSFPKWDEDTVSSDEGKCLTVVGDLSSVDLEVLGNIGNQWYRQSQDNPLSLPLDKSMEDTILLALEADLTDSTTGAPIMYAYVNDGSVQGWHVEHTKPYVGMVTANSASSSVLAPQNQDAKDADMSAESSTPGAASQASSSAFTQPTFAQSSSPFGGQQTSAFGQTGFGQPQTTSAFGQPSFGQPAFGQSSFGAFGQSSATGANASSAFGSPKLASGFGAFGGTSSTAFGSTTTSAFGSPSSTSAFGSFNSGSTTNAFGQGTFGAPVNTSSPNLSPPPPDMTREASMSDSTPSLGSMGLGSATPSNPNATNSMFGSFGAQSTPSQNTSSSMFGGAIVKPASGFGAFGGLNTTGAFDPSNKPPATANAFSAPTPPPATTSSGFGQSGFGTSAFGKPSLPAPAFGQTSLGAPSTTPTTGGFGAFASTPTSFSNATSKPSVFGSTESKPVTSGGFGAFASTSPATFGSGASPSTTSDTKPASGFGAFASTAPSAFGSSGFGISKSTETSSQTSNSGSAFSAFASTTPSPFGSAAGSSVTATGDNVGLGKTSVFGTPIDGATSSATSSPFGTPTKSPFGASNTPTEPPKSVFAISPPSSPEPPSVFGNTPAASPSSGGAFGNLISTPSAFKPATGFGAFGGADATKASPFFKKPDEKPAPVSVFGNIGPSTSKMPQSATTPTFGTPSALGGPKSVFAPSTPASPTPAKIAPTSGAFSAFSGTSSGFGAFVGPQKSFSELLKTGGEDPVKPSTSAPTTPLKGKEREESLDSSQSQSTIFGPTEVDDKRPSVSSVPASKEEPKTGDQARTGGAISGDERKTGTLAHEASNESIISASSAASSFVEVERDAEQSDDADGNSDDDAEHQDDRSDFLTDDDYEGDEAESDDEDRDSLPDDGDDDDDEQLLPGEPAMVPLPSSRSPSATPQPEIPRIEVSLSPPADDPSTSPKPHFEREASTTPPGTPVKEVKPLLSGPSTPNGAPFGIGLGRPSTRPTRSSPLANAVVPEDEDAEITPTTRLPPPVSPKPVFGTLPGEKDTKKEIPPRDEGQPPSAKRPKTPPLLSTLSSASSSAAPVTFGKRKSSPSPDPSFASPPGPTAPSPFTFSPKPPAAPSQPGSIFSKTPDTPASPSMKPQFGMFGGRPSAPPAAGAPAGVFGMPSFSLNAPISPPALPASSVFGVPPPPSASGPSLFGAPAQFLSKPISPPVFGTPKPQPGSSGQGIFGGPMANVGQPPTPTSPFLSPKPPPAAIPTPPTKTPEEILEEGMQKECVNLVNTVNKDLQALDMMAERSKNMLAGLNTSQGGSRVKADLGNQSKWGMADLQQFKQLLLQYQTDLASLAAHREKERQALREIQSNMLKAGTRREEVARFNKAKDDKEFAKMLKARTLGPEHSETQTQLRKSIRAIRDRVQKLERQLQDDKKKLAQSQTCRPTFKAPSLDTINRTYRNIDIAIEQQTEDVNRLATRIAKINLAAVPNSPSRRDARLPDPSGPRKPNNITENVAVTTAAALNAERSAQRLKKALLAVRKEPLLNTTAVNAPKAPRDTPSKARAGAGFAGLLTGSLFSEPPATVLELNIKDLPEDKFDPTASHAHGAVRRAGKTKSSHTPAPKSSGAPGATAIGPGPPPSAAAPISFDWGPLPSFNPPAVSGNIPKAFVPFSAASSPSAPTPANLPKGFVSFGKASSPTPPAVAPSFGQPPPSNTPKGFVSFSTGSSSPSPTPGSSNQTFSFAPPTPPTVGFSSPSPPAYTSQNLFSFSNTSK